MINIRQAVEGENGGKKRMTKKEKQELSFRGGKGEVPSTQP